MRQQMSNCHACVHGANNPPIRGVTEGGICILIHCTYKTNQRWSLYLPSTTHQHQWVYLLTYVWLFQLFGGENLVNCWIKLDQCHGNSRSSPFSWFLVNLLNVHVEELDGRTDYCRMSSLIHFSLQSRALKTSVPWCKTKNITDGRLQVELRAR